jgi:8-oxo-dGTP pyrophosphatase MutT (NUDIX family)
VTDDGRAASGMTAELPAWLRPVADLMDRVAPEDFTRFPPPDEGGRDSAVLLLFGEGPYGPDLLIIERAHDMRSHAGQPAFPGGGVDPGDGGPVDAALREAAEETGLDPRGVEVFGTLPPIYLPYGGYVVTPVVAWWREPSPIRVVDPAEVASVHRVPLDDFLHPSNRLRVRHRWGYIGPAFAVSGLLVWGFTASVLDRLFRFVGWERQWDESRIEDLPEEAG